MALLGSLGWACPANSTPTPTAAAPGGLYVGYYQEDPLGDPQGALPGAFVMTLPDNDAAFRGAMFFSVAGCPGSMASAVRGVKAGNALSGSWSGDVDGNNRAGPWQGSYDKDAGVYQGLYGNADGLQRTANDGCISHYIAPHGNWEMFPALHAQPLDFHAGVVNGSLRWTAMPGTALALVYFVDVGLAQAGMDNPIAHQVILKGAPTRFALADAALVSGRDYIAVTVLSNSAARRVAFASSRFTAP